MKRPGTEHYSNVASVYRAAVADGKPTAAVQDHFGIPRSRAAKWVQRARQAGLLEAAGGKGKRPLPTHRRVTARAVVKTWDVCIECLTPWPCDVYSARARLDPLSEAAS